MISSKLKRVAALMLAVILGLAFTACGKKENGNANGNANGNDTLSGTVYVPEYFNFPEGVEHTNSLVCDGEEIYFATYGIIEQAADETIEDEASDEINDADGDVGVFNEDAFGLQLYKMNIDGTGLTRLKDYVSIESPEELNGSFNISAINFDDKGNLWVAETGNFYYFDDSGNYVDRGSSVYLRKLDENGAEIFRTDITDLAEETEYFYIRNMEIDKDGRIFFTDGNQLLFAVDGEGNKLLSLESNNWIDGMVKTADGSIAVLAYEESRVLKTIDPVTKSWGETYSLPMNVNYVYSGYGEHDVYYNDFSYLIGLNLETGESTKLLNWINCDINADDLEGLNILSDGRILCVLRNYNYSDEYVQANYEIALLTEKPASEVPQKTILTMATLYTDFDIRTAIIDFNKKNPDYRIVVNDYSEYNTPEDYNAGLLKLSTEIISGNIPDILSVNSLPVKQYVNKGLLEDLYPYIDADTALGGREALVEDVFRALEIDGSLYQISTSFGLITAVGNSQVVGTEMGWTLDELNALLDEYPEGTTAFPNMTASAILTFFCAMNMDEYVDWSTGKCNYNSEGFIKLLEFAAEYPTEFDMDWENRISDVTLIQEGKALLHRVHIYNFSEIQLYEAMFGGELTFKGFPCENGIGNALTLNNGLAMTTKCKDKEGAWEFMRTLLTEEFHNKGRSWQLPTNKAAFDKMAEKAMEKRYMTNENGEEVEASKGGYGMNDLTVEIYATTQEQLDQILELIRNTDKVMNYDESIMKIISEEAEALFAGQKSAAETADIIQSRIELYVNEQR